jgi:preprotein translocase subunit SecE
MRLVADEPSMAEEIGKRARREVVAKHSWKGFFKSFDKELRKVSGR